MPKFAVYAIPPANSTIYRRGSEILGYDVRAGAMLPYNNPTRDALPEFEESWVEQPQTYGFHMTTGYSLFFEWDRLAEVEDEIANVAACFWPDVRFMLTPVQDDPIPFWRDDIIVLHYEPNPALLMLHAMLIARVNPLATGSNQSRAYSQYDANGIDPVLAHRVRHYYTPYMLDGWKPHFTLMMPYGGVQKAAMRAALGALFPPQPLPVATICLLVREDNEAFYRLHREFLVPGPVPQISFT
jgi:hypothetical protein